jgi:hypothetical protein
MHDRNAGPIENATRTPFPLISPAQKEPNDAHVQSGIRNMTQQVVCASHAMRGARQSCERLPAHPVVIAECSSVVSAGILIRFFTARYVIPEEATCSAYLAVKYIQFKAPGLTNGKAGLKSRLNLFLAAECRRATLSCLRSPRNECIWAICRHRHRRCEAHRRVVASWLEVSQQHRMKVARRQCHLLWRRVCAARASGY